MGEKMHMSLDEIIKGNKAERARRCCCSYRGNMEEVLSAFGRFLNYGSFRCVEWCHRCGPPGNDGRPAVGFRNSRFGSVGGPTNGAAAARTQWQRRHGIMRSRIPKGDVNGIWQHDLYDEGDRPARSGDRGDVNGFWKHDLYDEGDLPTRAGRMGGDGGSKGTQLLVSNLHYDVSESDINVLFADIGPLKSASVLFDRSGRSYGLADVVFERRSDAIEAMRQYNGVPLDGKRMKITLSSVRNGFVGRQGGGGGGNGEARRRGERRSTAEQLDDEIDAYVAMK